MTIHIVIGAVRRWKVDEVGMSMDEVMFSLKNISKDGLHYTCAETEEIAETALALLEDYKNYLTEQEAVKPVLDEQTGRIWLCDKCGSYVGFEDNDPHDPNEFDRFCRDCGTPVSWEG